MGLLTFAQEAAPNVTAIKVETTTVNSGAMTAYIVFLLIFAVLAIVAYWKIFTKAGEAGWKSLIPIWNTIVLLRIVGRPVWWILLLLIPFVNFITIIVVLLDLGKSFGKSTAFSVFGLIIFSVVGYFILGFGSDAYVGPGGKASASPAPVAS